MKFALTGMRGRYPSIRREGATTRAGFSLVESLVALALLLAFAAVIGPTLFHARHILARGGGQIRAELLLHSLLDAPFEPSDPEVGAREGESAGFHWRVVFEPFDEAASFEPHMDASDKSTPYDWTLYKVTARVDWSDGRSLSAETLRLRRAD